MATAPHDTKYDLAHPSYSCQSCGEEVDCGSPFYCAVFFEEAAFLRREYCSSCWQARTEDLLEGDPFAFWKTRRPPQVSAQPKRLRFDVDLAFAFFQRLAAGTPEGTAREEQGPQREETPEGDVTAAAQPAEAASATSGRERQDLAFVIALLLIRKKVLTLDSTVERDGCEWLQVSERASRIPRGEQRAPFWVRNPNLQAAQIDNVKTKISDLLQMQLG